MIITHGGEIERKPRAYWLHASFTGISELLYFLISSSDMLLSGNLISACLFLRAQTK
jgi:hypothetical protein